MNSLDEAIAVACKAHYGQVDKGGNSYILHPFRLMLKFDDYDEQVVAVLHDVVEDSDLTLQDLKNKGFSKKVIEALDCLTKQENEKYDDFILRVSINKLATKVKIEDIKDNMNLTRLSLIRDKDLDRLKKYHKALLFLESKH